jgi:glutathione synthase/RimK-type ligase-like ATP-grasp enzyme
MITHSRILLWKQLCDERSISYTESLMIENCLTIHLHKNYLFFEGRNSFNPSCISLFTKNKKMNYAFLSGSSLPIPKNTSFSKEDSNETITQLFYDKKLNFPVVIKPSNTNNAVHIYICNSFEDIFSNANIIFNDLQLNIQDVILQQFISIKKEYRVVIFNKNINKNLKNTPKVLIAYEKIKLSEQGISLETMNKSIPLAGVIEDRHKLEQFRVIIQSLCDIIPVLQYGGVDIVEDINGKLWYLEVNSDPGFRRLVNSYGQDGVKRIYQQILEVLIDTNGKSS